MRRRSALGALAFLALGASAVRAQEPPATGIRLDFQDADLRLVVSALAEAGNLNVVHADLPDRSVTLRMSRPVAPDEVLGLLRSLAASNGLEVVEDGPLIRILGGGTPAGGGPQVQDAEAEPRLYVHRLRHARAQRLAATLQSIFGGASARAAATTPRVQSLSEQLRGQAIAPLDPDAPAEPDVRVELGGQSVELPAQLSGAVQIVPDEATNSLLVRAAPADWEVLLQAIEALDLRPLQVLIEVVIAEVRRSSSLQLGVSGTLDAVDGRGVDTRLELKGGSAGNFILQVMRSVGTDVDAIVSALASSGEVRIVSRPVIVAQNNQQARILIGDERPFIQVFRSLPTDAAVRDQVVQYRDVGTSLVLVPIINGEGYVNLELTQEVSTATAEEQFGAPVISTREAQTQLFVRDGQTVVLGGLIDRQRSETESGVPLLKDIPLLGHLFKSTTEDTTENELFLFLTPHILETDEDAASVLERLGTEAPLLRPDTLDLGTAPPAPGAPPRGGR